MYLVTARRCDRRDWRTGVIEDATESEEVLFHQIEDVIKVFRELNAAGRLLAAKDLIKLFSLFLFIPFFFSFQLSILFRVLLNVSVIQLVFC